MHIILKLLNVFENILLPTQFPVEIKHFFITYIYIIYILYIFLIFIFISYSKAEFFFWYILIHKYQNLNEWHMS